MQNFMGMDGFIWFTGVVEDRNDPSKLGRVRVRIVGHNPDDKSIIPTEDLPWAHVMHPVTDPSMNGMGNTPTFLVEGTWVVGFFLDGTQKENPIIMGSLPGVPNQKPNTSRGFSDPNGKYPRENRLGESDVNRLARSDTGYVADAEVVISENRVETDTSVGNGFTNIPVVGGAPFGEPSSSYAAKYPFNHVYETESGHVKEFDDTEGEERIREYHSAGTYYEVNGSGSRTVKIVGDGYHIVAGSDYAYVDGHCNLTIGSNCSTYVKGDYDLRVDGNMEILVKGNKKEVILCNDDTEEGFVEQIIKSGKKQTSVDGDVIEVYEKKLSTDVQGKVTQIFAGGFQSNITGTYDLDVGNDPVDAENLGKILINTPTIETEVTTFSLDATTSNITATTINLVATTANVSGTTSNIKGTTVNLEAPTVSIKGDTTSINSDTLFKADATTITFKADSTNIAPTGGGVGSSPSTSTATAPSITAPDVTLPTIGNELLLQPLLTPLNIINDLENLESQTGAKYVNDLYPDAILRGIEAEKKLGLDYTENDGMESGDGGGNSISPITNGIADGTTDYNPNANYRDLGVPNSAGFYPYNKKYPPYDADVPIERRQKYDEDELLNFIGNADPRINPALGRILVELTRRFRVSLGKPNFVLPITSAFRTPAANDGVGGVKKSQHKVGNAVDVLMKNIPREKQKEFLDIALDLGITGVGSYFPTIKSGNSFFHLDIGRKRHWGPTASWTSQYAWVMPILAKYGTTNSKGQILFGGSPVGTVKQTVTTKTELKKNEQVKSGPGQSLAS